MHDGPVIPLPQLLASSLPGEHADAIGPVLGRKSLKGVCPSVRTHACMGACESVNLHAPCPHSSPGKERALLPSSALCTSPRDGYSNLLTSCFPSHPSVGTLLPPMFPSAQQICNFSLIVRGPFLYFISVKLPLHLQSNHISFHSKVTGYSLASRFLLYSCINLV